MLLGLSRGKEREKCILAVQCPPLLIFIYNFHDCIPNVFFSCFCVVLSWRRVV